MADRRLVLFDIDSTLLSADGAGRRAITLALQEVYGPVPHAAHWAFGGKTDPQICRELLSHDGASAEEIARLTPPALERYLHHLRAELPRAASASLLPGVLDLLASLAARPGLTLGLLTGNVVEGARIKLEHFGLWERFALGAYGSDHADRPALPAVAVARAEALTGHRFSGKEIVIIGDTEHDIHCGRHLGVKAIAVATGRASADDLAAHAPDHLFADLTETARVVAAITA